MDASSVEKKTMTDVVTEEAEDVHPTLDNSKTPFLKEGERSSVICCNAPLTSQSLNWCKGEEARNFIETLTTESRSRGKDSDQQASFTLVAGTGNGTLNRVSIERDFYSRIKAVLGFPDFFSGIIEQVLSSIHGVIASFLEDKNGQKFLLIIFSAPKAPVRELFCAMRIDLATFSTTCLLFDHAEEDLKIVEKTLEQNFHRMPIWHNPLAVLVMLARECGRTSETKRHERDDQILHAETASHSTLWENTQQNIIRVPENYQKIISGLHICHNNLTFIDHAVAFEIDVWNFLQRILTGKDVNDVALFEQLWDKADRQFLADTVSYELKYTMSKKLQIAGLQNRVQVQQSLVDNLIAGQEGTRTLMISILAALFASASLIASIFSCGIFRIRERAWVVYVVSTVALMVITVGLAIFYFKIPILWSAMKETPMVKKLMVKKTKKRRETSNV